MRPRLPSVEEENFCDFNLQGYGIKGIYYL